MGGGGQQPLNQQTTDWTQLRDIDQKRLENSYGQVNSGVNAFVNQARQGAGQLQTNYGQFGTQAFRPSNQLDAFSQNIVAQGSQQLRDQANVAARGAMQRFGTSAIGQALSQQAANRAALNANPLTLQAAVLQRGREGQEYQMEQGRQSFLAQLQNLGNAAIQQRTELQQAPLQAQQNLLSMLGQYAALQGKRNSAVNQQDARSAFVNSQGAVNPNDPLARFRG